MPNVQNNLGAAQDSAQARREFRERTRKRLSASGDSPVESTPADSEPVPNDRGPDQDVETVAQQLGVVDPQEPEQYPGDTEESDAAQGLEADKDADGVESDAEDDGQESEPEEGSIEFYERRAEQADEARDAMQRDYTQKTQNIANIRRQAEEFASVAMAENSFYVQQAEQALQQRFGSVNFADLRVNDPERHQKALSSYQHHAGILEQAKARQNQLKAGFASRDEAVKNAEAENSRDILKSTIPDWSDDRVATLRKFAVTELGYYDEAGFNDLTDWRVIALLDKVQRMHTGPKTVKELRKRQTRQPRNGANRQAKPLRNEKGQFTDSRRTAFENPGNRAALRQSFQDRLKAERVSGGPIRY